MVAQSISHYRILSKLGEGGMGEVYLAEDTRLERQVALKVLPAGVADDEDSVRRFLLEAKAASALNHPNILTVYEIGDYETSRYIATELVRGETLRKRLRGVPLPLRESLDIAMQIASALKAAHSAGIIHRDIKPENLMVRPDGLVKVLDFGLAKLLGPESGAANSAAETLAKGLTRPGSILGTLHYMSPEQVRGQSLDGRSDIFSLGAVLYEMLTGAGPFDKPTRGDVIAAVLTEMPSMAGLSRPLQRIVSRALQKDREQRYQTIEDLLVDLKGFSRDLERSEETGQTVYESKPIVAHATGALTARRFSLVHTLAILLLAGLVLSAVWWFARRRDAQPPASLKTTEVANWGSAPGEIYSVGSFSPDGARVAFVMYAGGSPNIYFKQTTADTRPVATTKDEFRNDYPVWSPDGEEIAFFSTRGNQYGLWRVPYLGGVTPTMIKTVTGGDTKPRYWSKSGTLYFEEKHNMFALDLSSGKATQLTNFDPAQATAYSLDISPDEKQVVYINSEGERWGIWTVPPHGSAARQLVNSAAELRNAIWHTDSQRILYSALVDGIFQIFVTDLSGSPPVQITFGDKDSFALDVAAGGAKILYGSSTEESDVWGVNLKGEEYALASDINSELWPCVAPDNKTVAFSAVRNLSQGDKLANGAILIKPTHSDASPSQLVADGFVPAWSPDGKRVAFMRVVGGAYNLWAISAQGGEARQLTNSGVLSVQFSVLPYNRTETCDFGWSPDGSRIVYVSAKTGRPNLWLVSADGANDVQLTSNDDNNLLKSPLWSSGGKRIAYTSTPDQAVGGKLINRVWVIDPETKTAQAVFQADTFLRLLGWSEDGQGLIVASIMGSPRGVPMTEIGIAEIATASGAQRLLAKLQSAYLYNIHLSADGRMIAYVAQQDGKDNLYTIPARGGTVKKLTANNDARLYFSSLAWSPDGKEIYFGKQSRYSLLSMITNFK